MSDIVKGARDVLGLLLEFEPAAEDLVRKIAGAYQERTGIDLLAPDRHAQIDAEVDGLIAQKFGGK